MRRRAITRLGLAFSVALAIACGTALAYYSSGGGGTASAAVTSLTAPTITAATPAVGGTVALTWKAVTAPDGGTVNYYVTRNGGEPAGNCPGQAEPESVTSCTDSGLPAATYEYKVIAVWSSWSKASAVSSAKVTVGPVTKFTITGASTVATGTGVNLTITAKDANNNTVTTYTGSHSFVFEGASPSAEGKVPTVANSSGTATPFGTATALTFTSGAVTASSSKNGFMQIYKPGEAKITATEGSLTTPVPLVINVTPNASRFLLSAETTTPTVGVPDGLTIKAYDAYGNLSTNYTGTKTLTFSGPGNAPNGKVATVENASGAQVNTGTTSSITTTFVEGIATASEATPGCELILYRSGANTLSVKEGSTVTTPTALSLTAAAGPAVNLTTTASATTIVTTTAINLTTTAKDSWGNTATSFTGTKTLDYAATGTAIETSPGGSVAGVVNSAGTSVTFGADTAITFTSGVSTVVSSKNGLLRLYKPGTATLEVEGEGLPAVAPLAFTVNIGAAKRVAFTNVTLSAGTVTSTTPCVLLCTISGLGNSGTITAGVAITDEYGNLISNVGAAKTVTVSSSGTTGSSITGSPLTIPASGAAQSSTTFTYKAPSGTGAFTNSVSGVSSGYTTATMTINK